MARLTLPMFILPSEVVSAPLFRVLQNHGSLNWSFCEVTKGTDDSLAGDHLHPLLASFLCFTPHLEGSTKPSVFAGDSFFLCFWKCIFLNIKSLMQGCIIVMKQDEKL